MNETNELHYALNPGLSPRRFDGGYIGFCDLADKQSECVKEMASEITLTTLLDINEKANNIFDKLS